MTVSTTDYIIRYSASPPTVTFAFPYKFLEDDDLIVTLYNTSTYVTTAQVEGTDYTVTGAGLDAGGSITFTTAPASGNVVSIVRSTDLTQLTDYVPDDNFNADDHEDALDKLTLIAQENFQKLLDENGDPQGRALIYPASDAASISNVVPASELRPNLLFQWNNASEPTTVAPADLNLVTLDNDPALGGVSPSSLSGVTQLAVKTYIDAEDTATRTGIGSNADGTYNTPSGTNFLDSTTDVMDAIDTLDEKVQCAWNGAIDLNTRVTAVEADLAAEPPATNLVTAWASFNGAGTKLDGSGNLSVVHNGSGDYAFTITPALANANYAIICTGDNLESARGNRTWVLQVKSDVAPTTTGFTLSNAASFSDPNRALTLRGSVMILGG